jgi:hypothetical protein
VRAQTSLSFSENGQTAAAAIPDVLHAALTGTNFETERAGEECCAPIFGLAKKRGIQAGILMQEKCSTIVQVPTGRNGAISTAPPLQYQQRSSSWRGIRRRVPQGSKSQPTG